MLAVGGALALAVWTSDRLSMAGGTLWAALALAVWACVAVAAPDLFGENYEGQYASKWNALIAATAVGAATLVGALAAFELRAVPRATRARRRFAGRRRLEQIDHEPAPAYSSQRQSS